MASIRHLVVATLALAGASAAVLTSPAAGDPQQRAQRELDNLTSGHQGVQFGVQMDWRTDSPVNFWNRTHFNPMIYGDYILTFPFRPGEQQAIVSKAREVSSRKGTLMLTIQPESLSSVTNQSLADLTATLQDANAVGTPVLVRFAHEMNGSWYAWGQQPQAYIRVWRQVANAVHQAPQSKMLWSPNEGGGYPFLGAKDQPEKGSPRFAALDTNHDGKLTRYDDPYAPYWPGSKYVDWVGLSDYHFGRHFPWGKNALPEPGKFADKITGHFNSKLTGGYDETMEPDFYASYSKKYDKPFIISETSALYSTSPQKPGAPSDEAIKQAWLRQVFAADLPKKFPNLRAIMWFEQTKKENDVKQGKIDWTITYRKGTLDALNAIRPDWLATG